MDLTERRDAIIDVGSNSLLLVVAKLHKENWFPIFETSCVTGLGEGTKKSGLITDAGAEKTLEALREAFASAKTEGVTPRAFGTMALRIATNADDFLERARTQATPVKVISGEEEARLGTLSVLEDPGLAGEERVTVIDVGGHSTEISTSARSEGSWATEFQRSFAVGTLSLRDTVLAHESPSRQDLMRALVAIDDIFCMRFLPGKTGRVVALGASATNLVTMRGEISEWDAEKVHGAYLDFEEISKFVHSLSALTDSGRAELIGIEKGRERTIHIGALILERALQMVHALGCTVSTRGWRHALLGREPQDVT